MHLLPAHGRSAHLDFFYLLLALCDVLFWAKFFLMDKLIAKHTLFLLICEIYNNRFFLIIFDCLAHPIFRRFAHQVVLITIDKSLQELVLRLLLELALFLGFFPGLTHYVSLTDLLLQSGLHHRVPQITLIASLRRDVLEIQLSDLNH